MRTWLLAGMALGIVTPAWGQEVTVVLDPAAAQASGVDADEIATEIESAARTATGGLQGFVDEMAEANAISGRGLGVDYASNPRTFFVGYGVSVASGSSGLPVTPVSGTLPENGFGFQAAGSAGLNLGVFAPKDPFLKRIVVSANGGYMTTTTGVLESELYDLGGHVQVKVIGPFENTGFGWGGVDVTTGYEVTAYRVSITQLTPVTVSDVTWTPEGGVDVYAVDRAVPIELSTNARISVISAYGGAAVDIHSRSDARALGDVSGPLTAWKHAESREVGSVSAHTDLQSAELPRITPRLFAGVELQASWFKLYGHFNAGLDETWSGHVGVRLAR